MNDSKIFKRSIKNSESDYIANKKAQPCQLPDRWLYCPPMGKIIANKFLPMKTPLSDTYNFLMPHSKYFFHPETVFQRFSAKFNNSFKIGMWIDLTNTSRYYHKQKIEMHSCIYKKLALTGHKQSPTIEETEEFIKCVDQFFASNPNDIIAIHCTHGFNRTGFLIAAYLHDRCDYGIDTAVGEFASCRRDGIYKQDYLNDLCKRYCDGDDELVLDSPGRPLWEKGPLTDIDYFGDYSINNNECSGNNSVPQSTNVLSNTSYHNYGKTCNNALKPKFMDGQVPSVTYLENEQDQNNLREKIRRFCKYKHHAFPGSQPVSLEMDVNLKLLAESPYMVSWKADGMRYLVLIEGKNQVYAFDRDNNVFQFKNVSFLNRHHNRHLKDTLVDAEMVIDRLKHANGKTEDIPRLLIYDIIILENDEIGQKNFNVRYKAIEDEIIQPRTEAFKKGELRRESEPIGVRRKKFWSIKRINELDDTQNFPHETDGLIFQPVNAPYSPGRCDKLLKWKPPGLSTIDFYLKIEKEVKPGELPHKIANLYVLNFKKPFAQMEAPDSIQPYDGKIIECSFDKKKNSWVFMRLRTDKSYPNAWTTATSVCSTILKPISKEFLYEYVAKKGL